MNHIIVTAYRRFEELQNCLQSIDKYAQEDYILHVTLNYCIFSIIPDIDAFHRCISSIKHPSFVYQHNNIGKVAAMNHVATLLSKEKNFNETDTWCFVDGDIIFQDSLTFEALLNLPKQDWRNFVVPAYASPNGGPHAYNTTANGYLKPSEYGSIRPITRGIGLAGGVIALSARMYLLTGGPDNISVYGGDEPTLLPKLHAKGVNFLVLEERKVIHQEEKDLAYMAWKQKCHVKMGTTGKGYTAGFYEGGNVEGNSHMLSEFKKKNAKLKEIECTPETVIKEKCLCIIDGRTWNEAEKYTELIKNALSKKCVVVVTHTLPENEVQQLCRSNGKADWCGEVWRFVATLACGRYKITSHKDDSCCGFTVFTYGKPQNTVMPASHWYGYVKNGTMFMNVQ